MDGTTKRRIGFGALTGLVIAGAIGVASMNASGAEPNPAPPYPQFVPYGTLTINLTNRVGSLTLALADGTVLTQAITTSNPCPTLQLSPIQGQPGATGNLLDFGSLIGNPLGAGGTVQLPSTLLGVQSDPNCGNPSAQVGPNEALRVSLGSFFNANSAEVTSGTLRVGKTGNQDNSRLKLAYDSPAVGPPVFDPPPFIAVSAAGTNVAMKPFAENITLGSDATQNSRGVGLLNGTVFNLGTPTNTPFENAVECDQTVTVGGTDDDIATTAVFYRAADNKGPAQCTDEVGVTVDITDTEVSWNNATIGVGGIQQFVAGLVTIDWAPIDASQAPAAVDDALAREIDYDGAGTNAVFVPVQWCSSFAEVLPVTEPRAFIVDMPTNAFTTPATDVPWCLVSDTQTLVDGDIIQTQVYYGQGDPQAR